MTDVKERECERHEAKAGRGQWRLSHLQHVERKITRKQLCRMQLWAKSSRVRSHVGTPEHFTLYPKSTCANKWVFEPTLPGDGAVWRNGISTTHHDAAIGFAPMIFQDWDHWWYKGNLPKPNYIDGMDELSWGYYSSCLLSHNPILFTCVRRVAETILTAGRGDLRI